jgi:RimJ/RimL family protein N-acetyltransferase
MPFPHTVPELADDRVRLRAHRPEDVDRIVEQSRDPLSMRFTTVPRPYDEENARDFLTVIEEGWTEPGGRRHWAVTAADDPDSAYLGTIDLRPASGTGVAETGFGLHPEGRGRGLMSHALALVTGYWFEGGGVRVYWRANRGNFASWRVAWACGFTFHLTLPDCLDHPDGPVDAWVASLGRQDPRTPRAPWFEPPALEGDGVRLRRWRDEDIEAVEEPHHPAHHMPPEAAPTRLSFPDWLVRRREQMSQGRAIQWCVADAATDRALGDIGLFVRSGVLDGEVAELGYQLFPSARGQGLGRAAARLATAYGLRDRDDGGLGLRRLVAETAADNLASNAVLEGLGFTVWGREPGVDVLPDGGFGDALHWQLLREPPPAPVG